MRRSHVTAATLSLGALAFGGFTFPGRGHARLRPGCNPGSRRGHYGDTYGVTESANGSCWRWECTLDHAVGRGRSGLAAGGTGPLSLGALVGAGVAAIFAIRERLKNR